MLYLKPNFLKHIGTSQNIKGITIEKYINISMYKKLSIDNQHITNIRETIKDLSINDLAIMS